MYVDACTTQGKYKRYLLRESYRQKGKVKHRTIANLSGCSEQESQAIRLALRHKDDLASLAPLSQAVSLRQGLSVGAVWLVYEMARQLGIAKALGDSRDGKLALWQVMARVIDQGSRLSAVRLAGSHAACDVLRLEPFDEDDLYLNLDWLYENQAGIETRLFRALHPDGRPTLFLYDVTSTYLEGQCNELAAFGYNRDGKQGKKQIVIGLLCNECGQPLSIEVFVGNTQDPATFAPQIRKVADRFGGGEVTFVGDRGMLKSRQIADLDEAGFHYITAITRPQIEALLVSGTLQLELFEKDLAEVETQEGLRYVLRRNPARAEEVRACRQDKLKAVRAEAKRRNRYLSEHPRARVEVALRKVCERCRKLRISNWVTATATGRQIEVSVDQGASAEIAQLDGCYALKTDLARDVVDKAVVHARYKDLALVEWAFRTSKTVALELRPVHVRRERRTRGHAFVVMLAYRIVQALADRWRDLDLTVAEGIQELSTLCCTELAVQGQARCNKIPHPRPAVRRLLDAAGVRLPAAFRCSGVRVATRKQLSENRKPR